MTQQQNRHLTKGYVELAVVKGCSASCVIRGLRTETAGRGLPRRARGPAPASPFRGRGFDPWSGKTPRAMGPLGMCCRNA